MSFELTGKLQYNLTFTAKGNPIISIELNEYKKGIQMLEQLHGADKVRLKISKYTEKRSLDANAYAWTLIGKIAEKTGVPKDEVYRKAIKEIGGNYDVVCIKEDAAESLRKAWERNGIGWQTEVMLSKLDGCANVLLYYGSSTYDTGQMSRLIENLIQDCEALGIETKSQAEIDSLLQHWR
jgi:hypothetical protein